MLFHRPYIVQGQDELITINLKIINKAEPAYATKLYAAIPLSTTFYNIPNICQAVDTNLLLCDMGKPLYQNKIVSIYDT